MNPSNDLAIMYAGWPAVGVLWIPLQGQGSAGRGILNYPGTVFFDDDIQASSYALQYPANTFPGAKEGDRFVIEGVAYTAIKNAREAGEDGLEALIPLVKS